MALSWCKVASNLDSHPKIRKAGRSGREVFLFALRRNAEPDNEVPGILPNATLDPDYLADMLMVTRDEAVTGVTGAVTAGLLRDHGDHFEIVGWEEDWGKGRTGAAVPGADRTAKWRDKQKNKTGVTKRDARDVTSVTGDVTRDAVTTDKKREEEKREQSVSGKPDASALLAETAVSEINRLAGKNYRADSETIRKDCRALVKAKRTPEQVRQVVQSKRKWLDEDKMREQFKPSVLLRPSNFAKYLDDIEAGGSTSEHHVVTQAADRPEAVSPMMAFMFDEEEVSGVDAA